MRKLLLSSVLCLSLTGCFQTCEQKVLATEATITRGYSTTLALLNNDVIKTSEAHTMRTGLRIANEMTDKALPLCEIDEPGALDYLKQANDAIPQVIKELETQNGN